MSKKKLSSWDMLSEMHSDIKEIKETLIPNIKVEMGELKVKAGIWAAVTGIIGGALAFAGERLMPK